MRPWDTKFLEPEKVYICSSKRCSLCYLIKWLQNHQKNHIGRLKFSIYKSSDLQSIEHNCCQITLFVAIQPDCLFSFQIARKGKQEIWFSYWLMYRNKKNFYYSFFFFLLENLIDREVPWKNFSFPFATYNWAKRIHAWGAY